MAARIGRPHKLAAFLITALLAIVVFGCGGGGGAGGTSSTASTSTTGVGTTINIQVIALFQGTQSPASPFVTQNPPSLDFQLVPGNVVQVELVGTNSVTTATTQVPAANFQITAPSSTATISNSGLLTAKAATPSVQYTVSATYGGTTYSAGFQVVNPTAQVVGAVQDTSGNQIAGVTIDFYDSSGTLQAQTLSGADGSFIANVPTKAVSFAADSSALTVPSYYTEYAFNNFYYSTTTQACYTPLPTLAVGVKTTLSSPIVVIPNNNSGGPPPPPTGCGQ
jgi:hypothetical protein